MEAEIILTLVPMGDLEQLCWATKEKMAQKQ